MYLERVSYLKHLSEKFQDFPIGALLGPRQSGKTTLARRFVGKLKGFNFKTNYFDLENPADLARLRDPTIAFGSLEGMIVVDEIQRRPDLFSVIRYLVDRSDNKAQFLILGSASRELIKQSSESLAGRIFYEEVHPFSLKEVDPPNLNKLWLRGGFPKSYLSKSDAQAFFWLQEYTRTYLEQDLPQLGIRVPSQTLIRFWQMLTHLHGNLLNKSELGRSFGVADTTVQHYLDILSGTFMIRQLSPWFANTSKRQVKAPKIYFRDSGLLHHLMGAQSFEDLMIHPKFGASWEGFALEQIIRSRGIRNEQCFFWAIHGQGELDLILQTNKKIEAFEFKYTMQPRVTKSMLNAIEILNLDELTIVAPVEQGYPLTAQIRVSNLCEAFFKE